MIKFLIITGFILLLACLIGIFCPDDKPPGRKGE